MTLMQQYQYNSMAFENDERARMQRMAAGLQNSGYNERAMYNTLPGGSKRAVRPYMQDPPKQYDIKSSSTGSPTGYYLEEK
jgi:hypothetical protein